MEKITREKTVIEVVKYKAFDGTEFATEEECLKYESTAECTINARVKWDKKLSEYDMINVGGDDYTFHMIKIKDRDMAVDFTNFLNFYKVGSKDDRENIKVGEIYCLARDSWTDWSGADLYEGLPIMWIFTNYIWTVGTVYYDEVKDLLKYTLNKLEEIEKTKEVE